MMCTHRKSATRDGLTGSRGSRIIGIFGALTLAVGALLSAPSRGTAQQTPRAASSLDARWQPWIGCWTPAAAHRPGTLAEPPVGANTEFVCVTPATDASAASAGVDVATVVGGRIVARERIDATGQSRAHSQDGCNGVESAKWSADGHRVFTRSQYTCPGNLERTSTGVLAISPDGDWVSVQGVGSRGGRDVRTLHYRDAGIPASIPSEIAGALHGRSLAVSTARSAAAAPLTNEDVIEASRTLDPSVVEAWVIDRRQKFALDARQLVQLADAGVPSNVTDAMVAVSYPGAFAINVGSRAGEMAAGTAASAAGDLGSPGRRIMVDMEPLAFPYDYYSPYGYAPYGYAPYGYAPYGGYYSSSLYGGYPPAYGWYRNGVPVIVLKGGQQHATPTGHVVKGRGYTQSDPGSTGVTASPRPSASPPSSSGANGTSSGTSSSPPPRTAKPRP